MNRQLIHDLGLLLGTAVIGLVLAGTWLVPDTYAGTVPTNQHVPGDCQAFADVQEFYALSDVSPPVPCDRPHQTEVYRVGVYTGPFADRDQPGLEALGKVRDSLCRESDAALTYLGARPQDTIWGLQALVRLPTPREWAAGERGYRCELIAALPAGRLPTLTGPLAGVLRTPDAARWRHCADGAEAVTCDRAHTAEYVNAWLPVPAGVDLREWAGTHCAGYVDAYLGTPHARRGAGVGALEVPGAQPRTAACVAVPPARTTGSLVTEVAR